MTRSKKLDDKKHGIEQQRPSFAGLIPLLVVVAGVCAYLTSFDGAFMFDEIPRIEKSEQIHGLWPPSRMLSGRRPVVTFTLALNYSVSELDVRSYHLVNLAIHVLAALTLFGILRRTFLLQECRKRYGDAGPWLAVSAALIWVVHPLQTQSVTYVIQRGESLMGLFYLLTLYSVIRGAGSARPRAWYAAAVIACALGMGSKAVMVTAPCAVLLYDRIFLARSLADVLRRRWGLYLGLAATWSILARLGIVRGVLNPPAGAVGTVGFAYKGVTPFEYALTQCEVILHYLRLSFWPSGLCLDYDWTAAETVGAVALPAPVIVGLLVGTIWCLARRPRLGFLGAWFFIILAPTSSFIPIKDLAFEHRMYLSLAAVVTLAVVCGHGLLSYLRKRMGTESSLVRWGPVCVVVAAVLALGCVTAVRNTDYHSRLAMWTDVVAKRPENARAHSNLGIALLAEGRSAEAIDPCSQAIRIDPDFAGGHYRLAQVLKRNGRWDEAIDSFGKAISLNPRYEQAHIDRGNTFYSLRRFDEAVEDYRMVMQINPRNAGMSVNLGNALGSVGKFDEAIEAYREAVRIKPDWVEARQQLASRLHSLGRLDEAIQEYREVLRQIPGHPEARRGLDAALARQSK